jgi:S-formylglutathione hydrolase FrmB
MKRIFIGLLFLALFFSILVSCEKRENPIRVTYPLHAPWELPPHGFIALQNNILDDSPVRSLYVYLPPQYDPSKHFALQSGYGFPVLYLLHDFGGDYETFYNVYKVQQIADRLIAEGEIQPMIIVMPDGYNSLGGSFYTNSDLSGNYQNYLINEVMLLIDTTFHTMAKKDPDTKEIIADRRYKAISGHGMGGYGAFKMALEFDTTLFQSVSAMSPFLSFASFLSQEMIDSVFKENGISENDSSLASYKKISPWPDSLHPDKSKTQLIFAMAAAFSPHDIKDTAPNDTNPKAPNFVPYFFEINNVAGKRYGVDLPFDSTRNIPSGSTIWDRWTSQDIKSMFTKLPPNGGFGELNIYFDCGDFDQLNLNEGASAFDQLLSSAGIGHTYIEYPGYEGYAAGHMNFIFDRLPEVLKFHSQHFPPPHYFGYQ